MAIDENTKEKIIDLYFNQHKTIRDIAIEVGKSSRDVIPVLREYKTRPVHKYTCNHEENIEQEMKNGTQPDRNKILPSGNAYKLSEDNDSVIREFEEYLYDGGGVFDSKKMPIIDGKLKGNLESVIKKYNHIISNILETREEASLKLYVITRKGLLVPVNLIVRFKDRYVNIELDIERLN